MPEHPYLQWPLFRRSIVAAFERSLTRVRTPMAPEFASHCLAPQLKIFRAKHPQIDVHILVGTRQRDLSRGEAELAVRTPRPRQKDLVAVRIGPELTGPVRIEDDRHERAVANHEPETLRGLPLLTCTSTFQMLQTDERPRLGAAVMEHSGRELCLTESQKGYGRP